MALINIDQFCTYFLPGMMKIFRNLTSESWPVLISLYITSSYYSFRTLMGNKKASLWPAGCTCWECTIFIFLIFMIIFIYLLYIPLTATSLSYLTQSFLYHISPSLQSLFLGYVLLGRLLCLTYVGEDVRSLMETWCARVRAYTGTIYNLKSSCESLLDLLRSMDYTFAQLG